MIQRQVNRVYAKAEISSSDEREELQAYISIYRNMLNMPVDLWTRGSERIKILQQNEHLRCGGE